MGDVVNLNKARKARERDAKRRQAETNRQQFGRSKPERTLSSLEQARDRREQDGHKIVPPTEDGEDR